MALKRQQNMLETFSMASMTDVVFLLLVFFMVTSTFIFPTAMEVNLPQSSEQTPLKPTTRIYIQSDGSLSGQYGDAEAMSFATEDELVTFLHQVSEQDSVSAIALYGDIDVDYGRVVDVLNIGARNNLRMVLATTPRSAAQVPKGAEMPADDAAATADK